MPQTECLDFELEVAVIIGRDARDLTHEDALGVIAGFTILNDWSARDLQAREMALGLGPAKGKDFASSLGPVIATPDALAGDPGRPSARMSARVNGAVYSEGQLASLHFSFADLLVHASRDTVLRRGDVIGSGTVGGGCLLELRHTSGASAHPWLRPGDVVELDVEGIGTLRNTIVQAGAVDRRVG